MRRNFLYVFVAMAVASVMFFGVRKMLAQSSLPPSMVTRAVDETQRVTLHGNVNPLAQAKYDQGAAPSTMQMNHMLLVLTRSPEQETALENLIKQQADKNSPNYHKWLTPAQFGEQFGLSDQDITAVTTWLGSHGFQVNGVAAGRNMIDFSGTAGEIQEAFHTEIHQFLVNGQTHFANVSDPQIPAALAQVVAGVNRLNDFRPRGMHHSLGEFKMDPATHKASAVGEKPQYTYAGGCYSTSSPCYAIAPYDFATIYNVLPLWQNGITGAGIHIAVVSDSDVNLADFNNFRSLFGLPAGTMNKVIPPTVSNPGVQNCSLNSDEQEAILDVEWSGAVAYGATIDLVEAPSAASESCPGTPSNSGEAGVTSGFGGDYAAYYEVNTLGDPILSDSYGECELFLGTTANTFYNSLWQQASGEGITVLTAAGDNGSAACDNPNGTTPAQFGLEVNGTASTPYDTAVGGTDFTYTTASQAATYWNSANSSSGTSTTLSAEGPIPETVYNDTCTNPEVYAALDYSSANNACNSLTASEDGLVVPVGSSGGMSSCTSTTGSSPGDCSGGYPKPTWQAGTGVPSDGKRDIPDLSLFAGDGDISGTFYIVCEEDLNPSNADCSLTPVTENGETVFLFSGDGGTSVSAQAMAGIVALVDQRNNTHIGSVAFNTNLYSLATSEGSNCGNSGSTPLSNSSSCYFKDVTTGTNSVPCEVDSPNCGTSVTSHVSPPLNLLGIHFRWTPLGVALLACTLFAATLLFVLPGRQRRWSAAMAMLLFAVMFGTVSCGGGGGNGTVTTGNGNTVGVLSGYNANAGYDEATGLGSINATNFVKAPNW